MGKRKDITGIKFGRLTAIEVDSSKDSRKSYWVCKCDCGKTTTVRGDMLKSGNTSSCGCLKKEIDKINLIANHSHKMSGTRIYIEWAGLKSRCLNVNNKSYPNYGGRGIGVCKDWINSFESFMDWALSNGYDSDLTIDRIDNNKGYYPENCRWVDVKTQCNNRRSNILVEYHGESITLTQLSERTGLSFGMLWCRYKRGDRGESLTREYGEKRKALRGESNKQTKITESQAMEIKKRLKNSNNIVNLSKEMNVSKHIIYDIKRGKTWAWL